MTNNLTRFFAEAVCTASMVVAALEIRQNYSSQSQHREQLEATKRYNEQRVALLHEKKVEGRHVKSIRREVELISMSARQFDKEGRFTLIRGPRGIGKTTAIFSALKDMPGVLTIEAIETGTRQTELLNTICKLITGLEGTYDTNKDAMHVVTQLYKEKNKRPLIVILQACPVNKEPAQLTAAARVLADSFGINVIIDCSESTVLTGREDVLNLEPMSMEMMFQLPHFIEIADELEKQGNVDIVLAVCGGRPLLLQELSVSIHSAIQRNETMEYGVREFVNKHIGQVHSKIVLLNKRPGVQTVHILLVYINKLKNLLIRY